MASVENVLSELSVIRASKSTLYRRITDYKNNELYAREHREKLEKDAQALDVQENAILLILRDALNEALNDTQVAQPVNTEQAPQEELIGRES